MLLTRERDRKIVYRPLVTMRVLTMRVWDIAIKISEVRPTDTKPLQLTINQ